MILQTTFPGPSLWSSCSAHRLRPLLFSKRRHRTSLSYWHFNPLKPKHLSVAASENGVFTSPEIAKTFDFTSEERIYNCLWRKLLKILSVEFKKRRQKQKRRLLSPKTD